MPEEKEVALIKIFGLEIPRTKFTIKAISGISILVALWIFFETKIDPYLEKMERGKMAARQLTEFKKHFIEEPKHTNREIEGLIVKYFSSDGCVLVARQQVQVWVPNPELIPATMSPGKITHNHSGIVSIAEAGGNCMEPHDGTFSQWTGEVNGCWIQVWRQWYDGCKGYAWFDSCNSVWDPQMYWVECLH